MALRTKLSSEQRKVLDAIHRGAQRAGASPKELKSAIETGLVESGLRNLPGGDADSQGWRQERASLYPDPQNLDASVERYFKETRAVRDKYGNAGDLAAAVQRPAAQYRGRYGERSAEAQALMESLGGVAGGSPVAAPVEGSDPTSAATDPAAVQQPVAPEPLVPQVQSSGAPEFGLSARNSLALPEGYVPPASTFAPPPQITAPEVAPAADPAAVETGAAAPAANPGSTLVVGDSLGVGTAPYLEKQLGNVTADVKVGRPSSNGIQVLKNALGSGQKFGNVVLDLGTNDGGPQQLRQSIREAKRLAGGANIYIPTVNGPGAAAKNKVIKEEAGGNVSVIDWGNQGVGSDGIHATSRGYQRRARLIAQAIGGNTRQSLGQRTASGGFASPERGGLGKLIGTPGSGTHTLGNWQSDNAVDIAMKKGTVLQSLEDGVVEKVKGSYNGGSSRFDGYQVTVRFKDGNKAFYTHLSKAGVKAGQKVRAGQAIGRSGAANGVEHLHLGVEKGDPRKLIRRGG